MPLTPPLLHLHLSFSPHHIAVVSCCLPYLSEFPCVHFLPELDHHCDPTKYECPTYKTAVRKGALSTTGMSTNYVVAIELKTSAKPTSWVMAGTAFLLNLTD